jgi:hypothetical protein
LLDALLLWNLRGRALGKAMTFYKPFFSCNSAGVCATPAVSSTVYGSSSFRRVFVDLTNTRNRTSAELHNGFLTRFTKDSQVFIFDHGFWRLIPSIDVFSAHHYSWGELNVKPTQPYYEFFPRGPDCTVSNCAKIVYKAKAKVAKTVRKREIQADDIQRVREWKEWASASAAQDPGRASLARSQLQRVAGVYRDKRRVLAGTDLSRTVLVSVLGQSAGGADSQYAGLLRNWQCYMDAQGFHAVTYLVPSLNRTDEDIKVELSRVGVGLPTNSVYLTYPRHLFWSLLANKTTQSTKQQPTH